MNSIGVNRYNVGRIAERIVSNELEYRGFRVSDLNKEGTSANADLLAARSGRIWQIQVKGATEENGWWFNYGHCTESLIANPKEPMFNRSSTAGFYRAEIVVLVSVKSPTEYSCLVLPVAKAEAAAQKNLDREFRIARKDGSPKKPSKVYVSPDWPPKTTHATKKLLFEEEQKLLQPYRNKWDVLDAPDSN
jgi:hypothetical protein